MNFVKRILVWLDDRSGFSDVVLPMLRHVVLMMTMVVRVWRGTCAFAVQLISGIALATTYVPEETRLMRVCCTSQTKGHWQSVERDALLWCHGLVVLAIIHMTQVFCMQLTSIHVAELDECVVLLFVVLDVHGAVKRWDKCVWSVTVAAEMAGRLRWWPDRTWNSRR